MTDSKQKMGLAHENLDHKAYLIVKEMINDRRLAPGPKSARNSWPLNWASAGRP
jgi:hypothetical protein